VFGVADDVFSTRIDFIATVVGRIGYAFNNRLPTSRAVMPVPT
jgi:hypothetical protein